MIRKLKISFLSALLALTVATSGQGIGSKSQIPGGVVKLPRTWNGEPDPNFDKRKSAVITIYFDGEYYFGWMAWESDWKKINESDIAKAVAEKLKDEPSNRRIVYIWCDEQVPYRTVLAALESIRAAGCHRVGLLTRSNTRAGMGVIEVQLLPDKKASSPLPRQVSVLVDIKSGGSGGDQTIVLNSRRMLLRELGRAFFNPRPRDARAIGIVAPKDKSYGDMIAVIDTVMGAGGTPIVIVLNSDDYAGANGAR